MLRASALPSGPTSQTKRPVSFCSTALCGTVIASWLPAITCTRTYWPGRSCSFAFGNSARICTVPSEASTVEPAKFSLPVNAYGDPSASSSLTSGCFVLRALEVALRKLVLGDFLRKRGALLLQVDFERRALDAEQRCAGGDGVAFAVELLLEDAGDARAPLHLARAFAAADRLEYHRHLV